MRPKAPWPLEEELGWVDYGFSNTNVGVRGGVSVEDFSGTPWFNFEKEVAGVSSWAAADADGDMKGYLVPPLRIKSIIHYAHTKGPHDPIVIDRWINKLTISEHDSDEECVATWPNNINFQIPGLISPFFSAFWRCINAYKVPYASYCCR